VGRGILPQGKRRGRIKGPRRFLYRLPAFFLAQFFSLQIVLGQSYEPASPISPAIGPDRVRLLAELSPSKSKRLPGPIFKEATALISKFDKGVGVEMLFKTKNFDFEIWAKDDSLIIKAYYCNEFGCGDWARQEKIIIKPNFKLVLLYQCDTAVADVSIDSARIGIDVIAQSNLVDIIPVWEFPGSYGGIFWRNDGAFSDFRRLKERLESEGDIMALENGWYRSFLWNGSAYIEKVARRSRNYKPLYYNRFSGDHKGGFILFQPRDNDIIPEIMTEIRKTWPELDPKWIALTPPNANE
jgi:hypothetical protein